jgi:hypothetical protein
MNELGTLNWNALFGRHLDCLCHQIKVLKKVELAQTPCRVPVVRRDGGGVVGLPHAREACSLLSALCMTGSSGVELPSQGYVHAQAGTRF